MGTAERGPPTVSAGFRHSAFTFGAEALVAKSNVNGSKIPPGQLVNLIQKGIMYTELEKSVSDEGVDADLQSWMEKAATFLARSTAEKYNPASLSTKVSI